jgi:hypothetical protein
MQLLYLYESILVMNIATTACLILQFKQDRCYELDVLAQLSLYRSPGWRLNLAPLLTCIEPQLTLNLYPNER